MFHVSLDKTRLSNDLKGKVSCKISENWCFLMVVLSLTTNQKIFHSFFMKFSPKVESSNVFWILRRENFFLMSIQLQNKYEIKAIKYVTKSSGISFFFAEKQNLIDFKTHFKVIYAACRGCSELFMFHVVGSDVKLSGSNTNCKKENIRFEFQHLHKKF